MFQFFLSKYQYDFKMSKYLQKWSWTYFLDHGKDRFSFTKPSLRRMLKVKSLTVWYPNKGIHTCVVFEMRDCFKVWGKLFWRNSWYIGSNMSSKTKTKAIFFGARFMLMRPFPALYIHQDFVFLWVGGNEGHSSLSIRAHLGRNSTVVHLIQT